MKYEIGFPTHVLKRKLHLDVIYPKGTLVKIHLFKPLTEKPSGKIGGLSILNSSGTNWFEDKGSCPGYDFAFTKKQTKYYFEAINYGNKFNKMNKRAKEIYLELSNIKSGLETIVDNKIKEIANESNRTN